MMEQIRKYAWENTRRFGNWASENDVLLQISFYAMLLLSFKILF